VFPVIHARALEPGVIEFKPERFDQVQDAPGGRAQPRHIPCVGRDFRLNKNDVHGLDEEL
jgi:hypothetical protein